MHCKKAALVINPRAGENVSKITDVLAILWAAGWKTDIALKEYGGHTLELAHEASEQNSDLLIAYGGDGTLNQVVNGVMNTKGQHSVVGVIPGGTANVWAGEIGIPKDPVKAALALVNSEARKVDVGHMAIEGITFPTAAQNGQGKKAAKKKGSVEKKGSKAKHHFLLMAGLGIDAAIMGNVSKPLKYRIGPLAVGISAAKELPAQRNFPIEIRTTEDESQPLWKGEAMQVVIGNTRRYGDIAEMTPDAYIDDGVLDVCVITAGDPLTTMQQLSSLLLRKKPDSLTAEYFHGAHIYVRVPASVPMQLDGSAVKLKDYLNTADYDALQKGGNAEQVMVTYRFDAMPHALRVAIPRAYHNELFKASGSASPESAEAEAANQNGHDERAGHTGHHGHGKARARKDVTNDAGGQGQTAVQVHTEQEEVQPASQAHHAEDDNAAHNKKTHQKEEMQQELPELVDALLEHGRKVTVVGKAPNADKKHTYIIAGGTPKAGTGEIKPVAVVVDDDTALFDRTGNHVSSSAVEELQDGTVVVVEGKKSKRGVIQASRLVLS